MIRNLSSVRRMSGRKISYDTPNPGIRNSVGASLLPKSWKFILPNNLRCKGTTFLRDMQENSQSEIYLMEEFYVKNTLRMNFFTVFLVRSQKNCIFAAGLW